MKNILLLSPTLYSGGGTERVLVNLANNLSKENNIYILTRRIDNKFSYNISSNCKKFISFQPFNKLVLLNRIFFLFQIFIVNLIFKIDINICFANSISLDLGFFLPKKTIAFEHWPLSKYETNEILLKKIKRIYSKVHSVIVLNQNELKKYKQLLNTKNKNIHVIYNSTKPLRLKIPKKNIVLSIAHFNDQKRNDLLIKSWIEVVKEHKNWKLVIIGEGPNLDYCTKIINKNNIQKYVEIITRTNNVEKYYSKSKIFTLSSKFEALPMVLIEAKSYGLPCISFDVESGPSEIINDSIDGFLIKYNDINSLAKSLLTLIEDETKILRMSKMSKIDYEKRFSPKKIYSKWRKILN